MENVVTAFGTHRERYPSQVFAALVRKELQIHPGKAMPGSGQYEELFRQRFEAHMFMVDPRLRNLMLT